MIQKCHTAGFGEFSYLSDLEKYNRSLLINRVWPFTAYKNMFVNLTCEMSAVPDHSLHDIHHVIDLCDSRLHNSINSCTKHEVQQVQQGFLHIITSNVPLSIVILPSFIHSRVHPSITLKEVMGSLLSSYTFASRLFQYHVFSNLTLQDFFHSSHTAPPTLSCAQPFTTFSAANALLLLNYFTISLTAVDCGKCAWCKGFTQACPDFDRMESSLMLRRGLLCDSLESPRATGPHRSSWWRGTLWCFKHRRPKILNYSIFTQCIIAFSRIRWECIM